MLATSAIIAAPAPAKPSVTWNAGQPWNPRPLGAENRAAGAIARGEQGEYRGEQAQYYAQKTLEREIMKYSTCPPPKGNGGDVDKNSFCYGTNYPCFGSWSVETFSFVSTYENSCALPTASNDFMTNDEFDQRISCYFDDGYYPWSALTAAWGDSAADRKWPANVQSVLDSTFDRIGISNEGDNNKISRTEWCNTPPATKQFWCDWEYGLDYYTMGEERCFDQDDSKSVETWKKIVNIDVNKDFLDTLISDRSNNEAWKGVIYSYMAWVVYSASQAEGIVSPTESENWQPCITAHQYAVFWMDPECDVQQTIQDVEGNSIVERRALNAKTALSKRAFAHFKPNMKFVKNPRDASRQGNHI